MSVVEISRSNLFVPSILGKLRVTYDDHDFRVIDAQDTEQKVQRAFLSTELRGIPSDHLAKFLEQGYLTVGKSGKDYSIVAKGRMLGGGPFFAALVYVGANVVGGTLAVVGTLTVNPVLIAAGVATITAAPYTLIATLPTPTP